MDSSTEHTKVEDITETNNESMSLSNGHDGIPSLDSSSSLIDKQERYCFQLTVFGAEGTIANYKRCEGRDHIWKTFDPSNPFIIKRKHFPEFGGYNRISRNHLEILGEKSEGGRKFSVTDLSSNRTLLNGESMEKNAKKELHNGDELGLLWRKNGAKHKLEVLFGLRFELFEEANAPAVPSEQFKPRGRKRSEITSSGNQFKLGGSQDDESGQKRRKLEEMDNIEKALTDDNSIQGDMLMDGTNGEKLELQSKKGDRAIKWTTDEEDKLMAIMKANEGSLSWKDVSLHFPMRSPDAVRNKYKKMVENNSASRPKVKSKPPPPPKEEIPVPMEISLNEESEGQNSNEPANSRKPWSSEEDEILREFVLTHGMETQEDWEEIASSLGRTIKSVKHKYKDKKYFDLLNQ